MSLLQLFCCADFSNRGPLWMPNPEKVNNTGKMFGLPLTVTVAQSNHVHGPVTAELKITNNTLQRTLFMYSDFNDSGNGLAMWLLLDGKPVALSEFGEEATSRYSEGFRDAGGPMESVMAGESKTVRVDLAKLFTIRWPGTYTFIVEEGPRPLHERAEIQEQCAAKTTFTLLPSNN